MSPTVVWTLFLLLLVLIVVLLFKNYRHKKEAEMNALRQQAVLSELQLRMHELAGQKFEHFKNTMLQAEQDRIITEQNLIAQASFERWKIDYESQIRQDAIKKSQAVTIGKVTEHIIPFFSGIFPYNPKEARFIGSPIDLIVFDGMETDPEGLSIHFIEVKTASSCLTSRQRAIKYAILNKRVEWRELRV
jgi:predicted Holliday junction resolvase-like endonuclease